MTGLKFIDNLADVINTLQTTRHITYVIWQEKKKSKRVLEMKKVKNILLTYKREPKVLDVLNELANLEKRKPLDSTKILILEAGKSKINNIKSLSQA